MVLSYIPLMDRRQFIFGLIGGVGLLGGYQFIGHGSSQQQSHTETSTTSVESTSTTTGSTADSGCTEQTDADQPVQITAPITGTPHTVSPTQSPDGPQPDAYTLTVRNKDAPRVIDMHLSNNDRPANTLLKEAYQFGVDTHLRIKIASEGQYTAKLNFTETDGNSTRTSTITTGFTVADCERAATRITITNNGVETNSHSTCTN